MKIIIIGGFLGSGKTTILLQFAKYLVSLSQRAPQNEKPSVLILENEIGENGVDDKLLASSGFYVENLFSGCACCTISGELVDSVYRAKKELDPEWLIVETTGVAYPAVIRENLKEALDMECRICILTDASRWARIFLPLRPMLSGQIEGADTVLINKIDLADEELLSKMENDITDINPDTNIYRCCGNTEIDQTVWSAVIGEV